MSEYVGYAWAILFVLFYMFLIVETAKWVGRRIQNWLERMDQPDCECGNCSDCEPHGVMI